MSCAHFFTVVLFHRPSVGIYYVDKNQQFRDYFTKQMNLQEIHYSKKLEEQTLDIRFFSLVRVLDILSVAS